MIAYFDCFSGISGDMTLAAFIDLGVPLSWLKEKLRNLPVSNFDLSVSSVTRNGIQATKLNVQIENNNAHRDYTHIISLINKSNLPASVVTRSLKIFERIASAESEIHNCPKEKVHFHEVGSMDAIIDIVGTSLCLDYLGIETIYSSSLPMGSGFVECQHGTLPLPAPATVSILQGVPVYGSGLKHELVTPTGAAIISTISESFGAVPDMKICKTGYGAGSMEFDKIPNLLRIITGEQLQTRPHINHDSVLIVETNIDDMNPEIFGYVMDRLFEDGALDVSWQPVFMKKNRPGTRIQVICDKKTKDSVINRILSETTALGIRSYSAERTILDREIIAIDTEFGKMTCKRVIRPDGVVSIVPEYESCKAVALERDIPIKDVYDSIIKFTGKS
ncbi:MAG: nickel pincer cofactor biosynthesis protein LarC [Desulfobacterales bacterium]|nr:nickel pincer cofactor biosynthesis protein LarC [Desulfobacterales bacterium]